MSPFPRSPRRRQLVLGCVASLGMPVFLTSCGGGLDSQGQSTPTSTPAPETPTNDVAITFGADDPRIIHFYDPVSGAESTYYGATDSTGKLISVNSVQYLQPGSDKDTFSIQWDGTNLELLFSTSDRFELSAAGQQYLFEVFVAEGAKRIGGIYDPVTQTFKILEPPATAEAKAEMKAALAGAAKARSFPTSTAALCMVAAVARDQAVVPVQEVVASVNDHCGIVTTGSASAVVKPATHYDVDTIGGRLIAKPPYHAKLNYDNGHQGFYGAVPLDRLNTDLQVGFKEVAVVIQADLEKTLKDESLLAIGAIVLSGIASLPVVVSALIDVAPFAIAFEIGRLLQRHKENSEEQLDAWEITQDIYAAHKSNSPYFPIAIEVNYVDDNREASGGTVEQTPGSEIANVSVLLPSTNGPCSTLSIAGRWIGSVTQPGGPFGDYDTYEMDLTVIGSAVTGTSHIGNSGGYTATMTLSGSISGDSFSFTETSITSAVTPPNAFWCLKSSTLNIVQYGNEQFMDGNWTAPNCLPGEIKLSKSS